MRSDAATGEMRHAGRTRLHAEPAYLQRDLGSSPGYRNARTLTCEDFRYFGAAAVVIPARLPLLRAVAEGLGQGHRVFSERDPQSREAGALFRMLWKRETRFTPTRVEDEARGHAPR